MTEHRSLSDFAGHWQITREITHATGTVASFTGRAGWTVEGDTLRYRETGQLSLPGTPPMQAEQRYVWHSDLSVYFEDGRFFHKVPATGGQTDHWCDPDTYRGFYDFAGWPAFSVWWEVSGPRKSYSSRSLYSRC